MSEKQSVLLGTIIISGVSMLRFDGTFWEHIFWVVMLVAYTGLASIPEDNDELQR